MSEPKWTPFVGQPVPEPERTESLRGSKDEIRFLLEEFDRLCTTLPVWAMRLINGLRHEWNGAQAELEGWKDGTDAAKTELLESQKEALERPLLAEIDELRLVVKGLAFANVQDLDHVRALQRLARLAIRSDS